MNPLRRTLRTIGKFFLGHSIPLTGTWNWANPSGWNKKKYLDQYVRYIYAIVSSIAQDSAKIKFEIYKDNDTVVDKHPFKELMKRPNPDMSQFQFLELHFTFMKLAGESYWYIANGENSLKPKELYLLRPDLMKVSVDKKDPRGLVSGYVLNKPDGKKETFEKEEILHFKMPNPMDPYYGMGVIEASKTYIQTEDFASDWTKNSIYNSGRPSGVLSIKGTIADEEFKQLKKQFKENYSGTKNSGKTMLLKGADGLDYQKLGMELGEVALKDLKNMTRDDLMLMFRVSKTMLGITDDVNRASALESRAVFTRNVIMPEMDRLIDHLNAFLMGTWGEGFILKYEDPTLQSDEDRLAEWIAGHNKWLTTNDIRNERKLDPIPGGDVIREPINLVPTSGTGKKVNQQESLVIKSPACRMKGETKKECVSRKIPEIMHENPGISQDQAIAIAESMCSKQCKEKDLKDSKKKDLREKIFEDSLFAIQDRWTEVYQEFINEEFELQLKEILSKNRKQAFPGWLFDIDASKRRITGTLIPLGIELMKTVAQIAFGMADDDETDLVLTDDIRDYITDRIERLAQNTNDQTIKIIEEEIAEGTQDGDSITKLRNRIKDVYKDATDIRAERIARTESLATSNEGALAAYRQSPLVTGKEWRTTSDPCEFCASLDGVIVELNTNFGNLGQAVEGDEGGELAIDYENIEHPPLHPNCRCVLLPVVLE